MVLEWTKSSRTRGISQMIKVPSCTLLKPLHTSEGVPSPAPSPGGPGPLSSASQVPSQGQDVRPSPGEAPRHWAGLSPPSAACSPTARGLPGVQAAEGGSPLCAQTPRSGLLSHATCTCALAARVQPPAQVLCPGHV